MTGKPGGTMLDLFAGSGTGAVAALRAGMKSISVERDPRYVQDIIKRLKAEPHR
jgi:DNA modification methylase